MSRGRSRKSTTFGELTSGKSLALGMVPGDGTEVLQKCGGYTYEQGALKGESRKGEGR
jgi:hypothetical protein